jgi:hypothetical protein
MLLIIAFIKNFKNIVMVPFLEIFCLNCFVQEHKFETWFEILLGNFFLKLI